MSVFNVFSRNVCLEIDTIPENTPDGARIFISGNFNDWQLHQHELYKTKVGTYGICIDVSLDTLVFKFHRGKWSTVEGTGVGGQRSDRKLAVSVNQKETYFFSIKGWEDTKSDHAVKIFVVDLSGTTPVDDKLYVSGNFVGWYPDREEYQLKKIVGNKYLAEIPIFEDSVFYKYTRGSWKKVEGNSLGQNSVNRYLKLGDGEEYYDTIVSWEDIDPVKRYEIILEGIPSSTPHDANIFVSGNMNGWVTNDTAYQLKKIEGQYRVSFFSSLDTLNYKFNRGTWKSVEGGLNGLAIQNRRIIHSKTNFPVRQKISSWEDINVKWFNVYTMALIIPVVIGILLLLALNGLKHQQLANTYLQLMLIFLCSCLVFRVLTYYREVFNWFPPLIVVSDAIYFLLAPTFYMYIKALLNEEKTNVWSLKNFIPLLFLIVAYIPFFTIEKEHFILGILSQEFRWVFALTGFIGLCVNVYYWNVCFKLNKVYQDRINDNLSYDIKDNYLQYLLSLSAVILFFWIMIYVTASIGFVFSLQTTKVSNALVDICWFLTSAFIYLFGFFAIRKPEIFKTSVKVFAEGGKSKVVEEEMKTLSQQLVSLMSTEKLFLNAALSLNDLSETTGASAHLVSKVINDKLKMNFYDYINSLRIAEFIERVNNGESGTKTFLAIAYEVGFSSKSTFNRAFKKFEKSTPRDYFKKMIADDQTTNIQ